MHALPPAPLRAALLLAATAALSHAASIQAWGRAGCAGPSQTSPSAPAGTCSSASIVGQIISWTITCPPDNTFGAGDGSASYYAGGSCDGVPILVDAFMPDVCSAFSSSAWNVANGGSRGDAGEWASVR